MSASSMRAIGVQPSMMERSTATPDSIHGFPAPPEDEPPHSAPPCSVFAQLVYCAAAAVRQWQSYGACGEAVTDLHQNAGGHAEG